MKNTIILTTFVGLTLLGCSSEPLINIITTENEPTLAETIATSGATTAGLYEISTFDVYVDVDTIHIIVGGKPSKDSKLTTLLYLNTKDSGRNWSTPAVLNNNLPTTIATRGNDLQLAGYNKHLVAVWQTQGELPNMGPLVSAYSDDDGKTWQQGENPAINTAGDQSHADLIVDQNGLFHLVWLEDPEENGYQSLRYARSENQGKNWSKAVTLDDSTCSCCWNTLAVSAKNSLNILYRDMKPRDMGLLQSNNNGNTWSRISTVGDFKWVFDGCPHIGGNLTYAGADTNQLHSMVWTGLEQKSGLYYLLSKDNGNTWSIPQKIGNTAAHGDIAALDTNHIAAVWDELNAEGSTIFYATSEDGGVNWLPAKAISKTGTATHPRLVATKQGYLALWTEKPPKQPYQLAWKFFK